MTHPFPLDGLRVLDLSRAMSGPYAGRLLSDLGAEVVKVELPGTDITQAFGPSRGGHTGLYVQQNTGKRNVSIDLAAPGGAELFGRLAEVCDVVIENFRPGTVDRLGVGWSVLSARNPALVMLSVSGFGQWGPEAGRQAYAPVLHAETGLLGRQAHAQGGTPNDIMMALADSVTALHGTIAVLAALRLRDRTGEGQHLDLSMFEAMVATDDYIHYSLEDTLPVWPAQGQVFEATGGPILVAADPKLLWRRLHAGAGLRDPDPDATGVARFEARRELMAQWIASFGRRDDLIRKLEEAGLAWGKVRTPATVLDSPTAIARGVAALVDDRAGGTRPVIRTPYRFSGASCEPRAGAAHIGEHNAEVLRSWLGARPSEVDDLRNTGVLVEEAPRSSHDA